ncbi:Hypothetical predicted protein [Paramuricea clavata]|uniref:Uncharacterized protein n=1 Tax=Paramuricea clavata TaxID=317549 RepID=A0A7D9EVT3_PARCT|nr:Hypothetical predicted protein [Paramuricea clavata]
MAPFTHPAVYNPTGFSSNILWKTSYDIKRMSIQVFRNTTLIGDEEIPTIRSDDGTIYFAAKKVALSLGYIRPNEAVTTNTRERMRTTFREIRGSVPNIPLFNVRGGEQPGTVFITESGLYRLIMRSRLPIAEEFQDWICENVIPSIRKTGKYVSPDSTASKIKSIKDTELRCLKNTERVVVRKELIRMSNLVKDPEAVAYGRLGGIIVQEKIRQTEKKLDEKELKVYEQEKEITKLEIKVSYLEAGIGELEDENERLWIENEKLAKEDREQ